MERIRINKENIVQFEKIKSLLKDKKVKFDKQGRLRYLHGAPVGDLILLQNGNYKESVEEWFDPDSKMAKRFVWPK